MDFCWRSLFSKASTEKAKGDLGRDLGDEWQKLHWHGNSVDFAMLIVCPICSLEGHRVKGECGQAEQDAGPGANGRFRLISRLGPDKH